MQDEVEIFGDGADALQRAAQKGAQIGKAAGPGESGAFERSFVGARA